MSGPDCNHARYDYLTDTCPDCGAIGTTVRRQRFMAKQAAKKLTPSQAFVEKKLEYLGISRIPESAGPMPTMAQLETEMTAVQQKLAAQYDEFTYGGVATDVVASAKLVVAEQRVKELEWQLAELDAKNISQHKLGETILDRATQHLERANRLSDEAGALRTELQTVKAELCDALRTIERMKRKAGAR